MEDKIKYGYNDINIVPEILSSIEHRSECELKPFLFTAPMSSVVNLNNILDFIDQGIIPIIPRNIPITTRKSIISYQIRSASSFFIALSLEETKKLLIDSPIEDILNPFYICIDINSLHYFLILFIFLVQEFALLHLLVLVILNLSLSLL